MRGTQFRQTSVGDMSVTTDSFGTADAPASNPSLYGLDGVNFFLAAALAGFGPYVAAYLADSRLRSRSATNRS
jgi:hypothetical protein